MTVYIYLVGYSVETIQGRGVYDITAENSRSFRTVLEGTSVTDKMYNEIQRRAEIHAAAGWAVGDREIHRVNLLSISRLRKTTVTGIPVVPHSGVVPVPPIPTFSALVPST